MLILLLHRHHSLTGREDREIRDSHRPSILFVCCFVQYVEIGNAYTNPDGTARFEVARNCRKGVFC